MEDFLLAHHVFAEAACIGGVPDAHMEDVTMISGQKKIHMIRRIQTNRLGRYGPTGINRVSRHIGVVVAHSIRCITVQDS